MRLRCGALQSHFGVPEMTTSSPDDTARAIVRTLVKRLKLRPGQGALLGAVIQNAQSEGVDRQDLEAGLEHANSRGWILYDPNRHWVGLTDAGAAAA